MPTRRYLSTQTTPPKLLVSNNSPGKNHNLGSPTSSEENGKHDILPVLSPSILDEEIIVNGGGVEEYYNRVRSNGTGSALQVSSLHSNESHVP
jgi:hypothetical protein